MGMRNWLICTLAALAMSGCAGKPSDSTITSALQNPIRSGLKIDGFDVPLSAVKFNAVEIGAVQNVDAPDGLTHYYVSGSATVILTGTGDSIAEDMKSASRQVAQGASVADISGVVMAGAFGAAQARNALRNVTPGTGYHYPFEAILTKVGSEWRVTEFKSKEGSSFETDESRANHAKREAELAAAIQAKTAEPKVSLVNTWTGYQLDQATGRPIPRENSTYYTGDPLYIVVQVEAGSDIEAKAKAGHPARVIASWHGPKGDEIVKKEMFEITTAGKQLVTFSLSETAYPGEYWASVFVDAQDDTSLNPGGFQLIGTVPGSADAAVEAARNAKEQEEVAARDAELAKEEEEARQRNEARRVADERQRREDEREQAELEKSRREADALQRLQDEHNRQMDAAGN